MLMKKSPVEGNQGLPLLIPQISLVLGLLLINLHTFFFNQHQASIDPAYFIDQLLLSYLSCFGLEGQGVDIFSGSRPRFGLDPGQ